MGKVRFGLTNVHYAVYHPASGNEPASYGTPVRIPGAVTITFDPSQNLNKFYADNGVYYQRFDDLEESGTLEVAGLPASFFTDVLGYVVDQATGMTYKPTKGSDVEIALLYECDGTTKMRGIRYNVKVSEPSEKATTRTDSTTPDTVTLNYTAIGRDFTIITGSGNNAVTTTDSILKGFVEEGQTAFNSFFTSVVKPGTIAA